MTENASLSTSARREQTSGEQHNSKEKHQSLPLICIDINLSIVKFNKECSTAVDLVISNSVHGNNDTFS
jgi:hypothetical protein